MSLAHAGREHLHDHARWAPRSRPNVVGAIGQQSTVCCRDGRLMTFSGGSHGTYYSAHFDCFPNLLQTFVGHKTLMMFDQVGAWRDSPKSYKRLTLLKNITAASEVRAPNEARSELGAGIFACCSTSTSTSTSHDHPMCLHSDLQPSPPISGCLAGQYLVR